MERVQRLTAAAGFSAGAVAACCFESSAAFLSSSISFFNSSTSFLRPSIVDRWARASSWRPLKRALASAC